MGYEEDVAGAASPDLPATGSAHASRAGAKIVVGYVAKRFTPETIAFIDALLGLPCVQMGLVTEDGFDSLPERIRERVLVATLLPSVSDGAFVTDALQKIEGKLGKFDLVLGPDEDVSITDEMIDGEECTLEILRIGASPVWTSGTRASSTMREIRRDPHLQWSITLPREADDPADAHARQMGFAALTALGPGDGFASVKWFRRAGASAVIAEVSSRLPAAHVFTLMMLSHGVDLYHASANAIVSGDYPPTPRRYASGIAFLRGQGEGDIVKTAIGWSTIRDELHDLIVEATIPLAGQRRSTSPEGQGYVIVRHEETAKVDAALERIRSGVRVTMTAG